MAEPVIFDDLSKKACDLLKDDYFVGTKMTMKVKNIKGMNLTAEAKSVEGKPVVSKISGDFAPCDRCAVKKISLENTGMVVADVDLKKFVKNTTFTIRTLKDYNEAGMKKASLGLKVMTGQIALDSAVDVVSQRFNAGMVYSHNDMLMGVKMSGICGNKPVFDLGMSYVFEDVLCTCVGYDLFKSADLSVFYKMDSKTRLSAVCKVSSLDAMPAMVVGIASKVAENTEVRAKAGSNGEVSGCFQTTVDNKMKFSGSMTLDAKNLNGGNHKVGFGVEFLF